MRGLFDRSIKRALFLAQLCGIAFRLQPRLRLVAQLDFHGLPFLCRHDGGFSSPLRFSRSAVQHFLSFDARLQFVTHTRFRFAARISQSPRFFLQIQIGLGHLARGFFHGNTLGRQPQHVVVHAFLSLQNTLLLFLSLQTCRRYRMPFAFERFLLKGSSLFCLRFLQRGRQGLLHRFFRGDSCA